LGIKKTAGFTPVKIKIIPSYNKSLEEDRFIAIGLSKNLNLLTVCHCYREDDTVIRIVSARKANTTETKMYGGAE